MSQHIKVNSGLKRKIFNTIKKELNNRNVCINKEYVVSVPMEIDIDKDIIIKGIQNSFNADNKEKLWMTKFIVSRLHVCKTKTETLHDVIYNASKINNDKEFMNNECFSINKECVCCVYDMENVDGHVCCKADMIKDPLLRYYLNLNSKTPIFTDVNSAVSRFSAKMLSFLSNVGNNIDKDNC